MLAVEFVNIRRAMTANVDAQFGHDGNRFRPHNAWLRAGAFDLEGFPGIMAQKPLRHPAPGRVAGAKDWAWVYGAAIWDLRGVPRNEEHLSIVPDGKGYWDADHTYCESKLVVSGSRSFFRLRTRRLQQPSCAENLETIQLSVGFVVSKKNQVLASKVFPTQKFALRGSYLLSGSGTGTTR
jgi:hypothetical protein